MTLKYDHLLGKPWEINEQDCFSLGRDFFTENFGLEIPNIARPQDWDANVLDLIKLSYPGLGFEIRSVEDWNQLRPADVLAIAIGANNANHLAIYVGDNEIIHHLCGKNSCKELLRPYWRMSTLYTLRHITVPDLRPELIPMSLEELLRGRYTGKTAELLSRRG